MTSALAAGRPRRAASRPAVLAAGFLLVVLVAALVPPALLAHQNPVTTAVWVWVAGRGS